MCVLKAKKRITHLQFWNTSAAANISGVGGRYPGYLRAQAWRPSPVVQYRCFCFAPPDMVILNEFANWHLASQARHERCVCPVVRDFFFYGIKWEFANGATARIPFSTGVFRGNAVGLFRRQCRALIPKGNRNLK